MTDDPNSAMRPLERPRPVLVDPRRLWIPPERDAPREGAAGLGVRAASLDLHLDREWIAATQYAWARFFYLRIPVWYAQVSIDLWTRNRVTGVTLYQWVPWDAVRPQ